MWVTLGALCCRFVVHLSALQTAATAREDLQQAVQALADLSSLQASSSDGNEVLGAEGRQENVAADAQPAGSSAAQADAAEDNGSAAPLQACRKPRALFLAYYNQVSPLEGPLLQEPRAHPSHNLLCPPACWLPLQSPFVLESALEDAVSPPVGTVQADHEDLRSSWRLPKNVALCSMPSPSIAYEDCVLEAESLMQQLFPGLEGLFAGKGPVLDDDSDDEAIEALSEALGKLGDGQNGVQ